jgi:hypothetical protein
LYIEIIQYPLSSTIYRLEISIEGIQQEIAQFITINKKSSECSRVFSRIQL